MRKKYGIQESKDGSCPYCGSGFVIKTEMYNKDEFIGEVPSGCGVYRCYTCNKLFFRRKD